MLKSIIIIFSVFSFYFIIPSIIKIFLKKRFIKHTNSKSKLFLTFDDGPEPSITPRILELLNKYHIKATFFIIGKRAKDCPELIKSIIANRHIIGEHGFVHRHPWKSDPITYAFDLYRSNKFIKEINKSKKIIYFRPPYGKFNLITIIYLIISRRKVFFWDIDPRDYKASSAKVVVQKITSQLRTGSVILFHDGRINRNVNNCNVTVSALKQLLASPKVKTKSFSVL